MPGSKEPGLAIAAKKPEIKAFVEILGEQGFKEVKNADDLFENGKKYFVVNESLEKDIYDFVVQYPSGQVELFDKTVMKHKIFFPEYAGSALVLLIQEKDLNKIKKQGFDLLAVVGPTYRL